MNDLRVLFTPQIFQLQRYGGISRYIVELADAIRRRALAKVGVCVTGSLNEYIEQLHPSLLLGASMAWRPSSYKLRRAAEVIWEEYAARLFRPGVIHETYYRRSFRGPRAPKRVVTVHDMIHERFPHLFDSDDRTAEIKAAAVLQADHVICVSENTRRDLMDLLNVPRDKVTVTHLASSMPVLASRGARSSHPVSQRPYLLYVGGRSGYKNFWRFVEAVSSARNLEDLDVVCFGGGGMTSSERARLDELGLGSHRLRQVSGDDGLLSQYYQGASCLVYPSLYEGFGIPPLEAMANRCPVVCSETSSVPEVVADAGEYFNPNITETISDAIERVVLSEQRTAELVEKGHVRAKAFSWDQCADRTLGVYRALDSGRRAM